MTLKIKNSIKPHRVQHILRHFYYTTIQKLCKFEALYWPEIQYKCHINGNLMKLKKRQNIGAYNNLHKF